MTKDYSRSGARTMKDVIFGSIWIRTDKRPIKMLKYPKIWSFLNDYKYTKPFLRLKNLQNWKNTRRFKKPFELCVAFGESYIFLKLALIFKSSFTGKLKQRKILISILSFYISHILCWILLTFERNIIQHFSNAIPEGIY